MISKRNLIAVGLIVIGILFVITGIYRSEVETVFTKATNICLECIGIG